MPKRKENTRKEICFSPAEWEAVKKRAKNLSLRTATYIRRISTNGEIKNYDFEKYDDLLIAINAIGTNVNQVAKRVNSTNSITQQDVDELKNQIDNLDHWLHTYLTGLEYENME